MEKPIDWMVKGVNLLAFLLISVFYGFGQTGSNLVSFHCKGQPIEEALERFAQENDLTYSFNAALFNQSTTASCNFRKRSVEEGLLEIIQNPAIGIRVKGNSFVLYEKPIRSFWVSGTLTDKRTGEGIPDVRIAAPSFQKSTKTNKEGDFKIHLETYSDSVTLILYHPNYDEEKKVVAAKTQATSFSLMPLPVYIPSLPSLDYAVDDVPVTASIQDNFLVKMVTAESVVEETETDTNTFFAPYQIGLVPPLNNHGLRSGRAINQFSFNLFSGYAYGLEGVEVGTFLNIVRNRATGLQVAGFGNVVGNRMEGLQGAGFFNFSKLGVYGVHGSGFANISLGRSVGMQGAGFINVNSRDFYGIQASGFSNFVGKNMHGIQLSGFHNTTVGRFNGIQAAGFINTSSRQFNGLQTSGFLNIHIGSLNGLQASGFSNIALDVNGLQASGFINAARQVNGLQIGFVNVCDSINGLPIGFLNVVLKGMHKVEVGYNELGLVSAAFKTGTFGLHNIFIGMVEPREGQKTAGIGYGLGTMLGGRKKAQVGLSALAMQFTQQRQFINKLNLLARVSLQGGFSIYKGLHFYAGPSINIFVRQPSTLSENDYVSMSPFDSYLTYSIDPDKALQGWIGWETGIRF